MVCALFVQIPRITSKEFFLCLTRIEDFFLFVFRFLFPPISSADSEEVKMLMVVLNLTRFLDFAINHIFITHDYLVQITLCFLCFVLFFERLFFSSVLLYDHMVSVVYASAFFLYIYCVNRSI